MPDYDEELQILFNEISGKFSIDQYSDTHNPLATYRKLVTINLFGQKHHGKSAFLLSS